METYKAEHNKAAEQLNEGSESIEALNNNKISKEAVRPINREEISIKQGKLTVIEGLLQSIMSSGDGISNLENKVKDYIDNGLKIKRSIEMLEESLKQNLAEESYEKEKLDGLLMQQKLHTSALLAKTLAAGEKCPVCGSLEHPEPAIDMMDEESKDIEQRQNELKNIITAKQQNIRELEHELIKLKQQYSSLVQITDQANIELQSKQEEYQKHIKLLPSALKGMEQEEIKDYIRIEKATLEKAALEYSKWEEELQQLNESIKKQESAMSEIKIQEGRYAALLDNTRMSLVQEQGHLEEYKRSFAEASAMHQQMKQKLGINSFLQEADIIIQKDEKAQVLTAAMKEKRSKYDASTMEYQMLLEKINGISELLNEKRSEGIKLKEQKEEKNKKITSIIGEKSLQLEQETAAKEMTSLDNVYKSALEELNDVNSSLEEMQRRKAGLQSSFEHYKQKMETDSKILQEALISKGFADELQVEECMLEDDKLKQYLDEIAKYKREKSSMEDRLQSIRSQLGGQILEESQWQLLCKEYENVKLESEDSISKLEAARNNYKQIKESFEKWIKLQTEQKGISKNKDMLEQIQKLLKGNGFIEFISEERMRYIAREASETLGDLTKFRYSIELDSENGFVIRDNANGGVLRSVASLSGGETFLTSLSLALALSSQLQLKGQSPLEFFFLDEGFGTLDNTLLDTVIDSLERLSSSKRVIGLISHVPEMKSRINRRLIVEAPNREGKGSRIGIEKA
jgi:exonuclease SbcC